MEQKDTRSGFGAALEVLGKENPDVVGLCADLTGSLMMTAFKQKYPDRFFQAGIAEANMIGVAAGLATQGKIPFAATFANFATGRVFDQIRQSVAYSQKNVKICASHAGLTLGEDGATHQILEDIGLMRMLPNMTVINPADYNQTYLATLAVAEYKGAVYLRFGRPKVPVFTDINAKFEIGKAITFKQGKDVSIFATGHLLYKAILAAEILSQQGIHAEVINIHTIKPLDTEAVLDSVSKTKRVVTAEEHQKNGGLGDAIAQLLAEKMPVRMRMVAVNDKFGESGTPDQLLQKYGLTEQSIIQSVLELMK
jgi:transketolase